MKATERCRWNKNSEDEDEAYSPRKTRQFNDRHVRAYWYSSINRNDGIPCRPTFAELI